MLLKNNRRAGVTLIELLVVIAIIAILVSLLMAAVMRAKVAGLRTQNGARIQEISEAVGRCKGDLKLDYIPSGGGFNLKKTYSSTDPEVPLLLQAFPNLDINDTGYRDPTNLANPNPPTVTLDGNQTLCFFLAGVNDNPSGTTPIPVGTMSNARVGFGFSNNSRQPFLPAKPGESRKGPWIQPNQNMFQNSPTNGFPWLMDVYGTPFAYFASVRGKPNNYGAQSYAGTSPYMTGPSRFVNENGFQILSAGYDKVFGPGGGNIPATGNPGGADDQSNFSKSLLGGGIN